MNPHDKCPREVEKWLRQSGAFLHIESNPEGVNIIWNSGPNTKIDRGVYFDVMAKTRGEAMDILFDHVKGYLYDLILSGGDIKHFPRKLRIRLPE